MTTNQVIDAYVGIHKIKNLYRLTWMTLLKYYISAINFYGLNIYFR